MIEGEDMIEDEDDDDDEDERGGTILWILEGGGCPPERD